SATADLEVKRRIDYRGILISEVFYDAAGSDTGREYIEIHNGSDYPCDLTGLAIVDGAGASRPFAFPDGSVI
ncbi:MAG: lamin tail domain-containing protein, partial [Chrysiogenales bacterium]